MIRKCESCYYQVEQRSSQNQKAYSFYETYSTFTALMFLKGIFKLSSFRTIKIHEIDFGPAPTTSKDTEKKRLKENSRDSWNR